MSKDFGKAIHFSESTTSEIHQGAHLLDGLYPLVQFLDIPFWFWV
jgi:hypothetical protein